MHAGGCRVEKVVLNIAQRTFCISIGKIRACAYMQGPWNHDSFHIPGQPWGLHRCGNFFLADQLFRILGYNHMFSPISAIGTAFPENFHRTAFIPPVAGNTRWCWNYTPDQHRNFFLWRGKNTLKNGALFLGVIFTIWDPLCAHFTFLSVEIGYKGAPWAVFKPGSRCAAIFSHPRCWKMAWKKWVQMGPKLKTGKFHTPRQRCHPICTGTVSRPESGGGTG